MTNSGSDVYDELKNAVSKVRSEERKLESSLSDVENKISNLTSERELAYVKLAEIYLPSLDASTVKKTITGLQSRVQEIFVEKQQKRTDLDSLIEKSKKENNDDEKSLSEVTSKLNVLVEERERLKKDVSCDLSKNDTYTKLLEETRIMKEKLDGYKKRQEAFEGIARKDIDSYKSNALFKYLLDCDYSLDQNSEYTAKFGNNNKRLAKDAKVAKVIDFSAQKQTYDMLTQMPELLKQRNGKRQQEIDNLIEKLTATEKEAEDRYKLTPVLQKIEALLEERKKYQSHIQEHTSNYEQYSAQRKELDGKKDPFHAQAIAELKKYLKGDDLSRLRELARSTDGNEDDIIVERMGEIDGEIRQLKDLAKSIISKREEVSEKVKGLSNIANRFSSNDYESSRSYFDSSFNVNSLVTGYLLGKMNESSIWSKIDNEHHRRPAESYHSSNYSSYGGSSSYGSSSHSSSFGSFGGGGHSSSGGF
ncbi:MAG: hypothetical protein WC755_00320 [Candidatus Woesearchaeota archaeon]|jgi:uncharacterized tellurite resistance protein B-like protein